MIKILITSAGGSGSNSLSESLRMSSIGKDIYIVGTHADRFEIACSVADKNYLVSWAKEEDLYIKELVKIAENESIDLIIPNSDKEVKIISKHRRKIRSRLFLPDGKCIDYVQDKFKLFNIMKENGVPVAETYDIDDLDEIEKYIESLSSDGKFWIRVKTGAGSIAATWVKTAEQAKAWIKLWQELQGINISQFIISEFLPGNDYAVHTIWKDGELLNAKICQRLTYFYGEMRLSGMASTPGIAKTVSNRDAIDTCVKAIRVISKTL